jgi:ribonuclease E
VTAIPIAYEDDDEEDEVEDTDLEEAIESDETIAADEARPEDHQGRGEPAGRGRKRRRRGRRGGEGREDRMPREASAEQSDMQGGEADATMADSEFPGDGDRGPREDGDGERGDARRRRRGRRGGRRNRRDRPHDGERTPSDAASAFDAEMPPSEQEFRSEPPSPERHDSEAVHRDERVEDQPTAAPFSPPQASTVSETSEPSAASPRRRRSTVREPAPVGVTGEAVERPPASAPVEAPQPVVSSVGESETAEQPRRSGWWSRRMAGKG